jgi:hypothetical protein
MRFWKNEISKEAIINLHQHQKIQSKKSIAVSIAFKISRFAPFHPSGALERLSQ